MKWTRPTKGEIEVPILEYLEGLLDEEIGKGNQDLRVCVGTDSQIKGNNFKFATVILLIVEGNGAMIMGKSEKEHKDHFSLNQRMLAEVKKSIDVADHIRAMLDDKGVPLEVHVDINNDVRYDSNQALQQAIGWVKGLGYYCETKPYAYAASKGADKIAKN